MTRRAPKRATRVPTLAQCEAAVGEPASAWVSRCYEIASKICDAGIVDGSPVYGHWVGPIAPGSHFARFSDYPFVRHGWVLQHNDRVCDPTRWVFEGAEPYIYVGEPDHYDEGGDAHRAAMCEGRPPPRPEGPRKEVNISGVAEVWLRTMFGLRERETRLAPNQLFYVANLPYRALWEVLGPAGLRAVYEAISGFTETSDCWTPIDNQTRAARECGFKVP